MRERGGGRGETGGSCYLIVVIEGGLCEKVTPWKSRLETRLELKFCVELSPFLFIANYHRQKLRSRK